MLFKLPGKFFLSTFPVAASAAAFFSFFLALFLKNQNHLDKSNRSGTIMTP